MKLKSYKYILTNQEAFRYTVIHHMPIICPGYCNQYVDSSGSCASQRLALAANVPPSAFKYSINPMGTMEVLLCSQLFLRVINQCHRHVSCLLKEP